jgi:hypothetical protein
MINAPHINYLYHYPLLNFPGMKGLKLRHKGHMISFLASFVESILDLESHSNMSSISEDFFHAI